MGRKIKGGKLVTFEGPEGSGKSTLIRCALGALRSWGYRVEFYREPGSTAIGEKIRNVLLDKGNKEMSVECELLLYLAARAQLVRERIEPALKEGKIVVCDRYEDSTLVYQGYAGGLGMERIRPLNRLATGGIKPHLTFVLDVDVKRGLSRGGRHDRIERKSLAFHRRVRKGYLKLAKKYPRRVVLIEDEKRVDIKKAKVRKKLENVFYRSYSSRSAR